MLLHPNIVRQLLVLLVPHSLLVIILGIINTLFYSPVHSCLSSLQRRAWVQARLLRRLSFELYPLRRPDFLGFRCKPLSISLHLGLGDLLEFVSEFDVEPLHLWTLNHLVAPPEAVRLI